MLPLPVKEEKKGVVTSRRAVTSKGWLMVVGCLGGEKEVLEMPASNGDHGKSEGGTKLRRMVMM